MRKTCCAALVALVIASPAFAQRVDQLPAARGGLLRAPASAPSQAAPSPVPSIMRAAPPSASGLQDGIAAIVNDAVITVSDVRERIKLVLLSAGFPDTQESRRRVLPQVMRSLIEEQIQLQEGKKDDIKIDDADVLAAMNRIAEENKIPGGNMTAFLTSQGVAPATLKQQVLAGMTWGKVVMRRIRPRIDIGDDEIDAAIEKMRANAGRQEYLVSEIFLPVDKPDEDEQVRTFASDLVEKLKSGTTFPALARQFSQSASAATGGDIGWIQSGAMDAEVDKVLQNLNQGEIGGPVLASGGYHILGVRDKRTVSLGDLKDMKLHLGQLFKSFGPRSDKDAILREGEGLRNVVTSCTDVEKQLKPDYTSWSWQDLGTVQMDEAPKWLIDQTANLNVGEAGMPMATDRGALVLFLCDREMPEHIDRDAIRSTIGSEKMELLARSLMRDMRSDAYIDVRIKDAP